ncbi:hypothetical protein I4U23_016165 [Adineta vaga]|nr:hypothetical protein I4U23_016165 [Adineta vaga]
MSHPTGMNQDIAMQYQHVASQLHDYVNNSTGNQLHSAGGYVQQIQPTHGVAYASHTGGYYNQTQMSAHPGMNNNIVEDFTGRFLRNIFH